MEQLLNVHRASMPGPSPDGSVVAFLSDAPGVPQAFTVQPGAAPVSESGWRRVVTIDDRIHFVRFTPNGRYLFLGRDHDGDENVQILRASPTGEGLVDLTNRTTAKYMFGAISRDSRWIAYASNERSAGDFDVYVRPVEGGEPRRLFEAERHFEALDFSPDARQLVVSNEHSSFDNDLYLVDVATGARTLLTRHTGDVRYQFARFTRDGRALVLASDLGREFMNLAVMALPSGNLTFAIDDGHDVDAIALSPAGNALALAVNVDGWTEVRLYDPADPLHPRPLPPVQLPRVVVTSMEFSADGRTLVLAAGRASLPDEIFRIDVATGRAERVTQSDHAGIDEDDLVEPVLERVRSFDGTEVPVFLYRPRDLAPGERAPVVVMVHGGPEAQAVPRFNPVIQFLLGHGYMVAEPNVRGSTGYGKRYAHLDDVEHREDSVRDLAEVNRWLRTRPDVDPDRLAVMGGSYGGYMTLAAITLYPELWAAACDIVGIANFRTFLERTAAYRRHLREAEYGTLARDGALLDRISPLHRVDRIRTPLFVIHGANDPRVPVHEAEQIVQALRARNQRVEYLRFENEGHGVTRRENKIRAYGELVRFFDSVMSE
jgi:dipeptidyl aminopeptidase/acylaminoacyl peptidase